MIDGNKSKQRNWMKPHEDEEESTDYLDIWRENPAYKDIAGTFTITKLISLIAIVIFIANSTLILNSDLYISVGSVVILLIFFLIAFHNDLYSLEQGFKYKFRKFAEIKPFDNFRFYMLEEDPATLLIMNKKDMVTVAIRIFKVEVLAANIKPTINQFLYALDESKIPYTYQVVQKPIIKLNDDETHQKEEISHFENPKTNTMDTYQTQIYFSVYYAEKGTLSSRKLNNLLGTIILYSKDLKSNFSANFHHMKISLLKRKNIKNEEDEEETEEDLISAIRTLVYGNSTKTTQKNEMFFSSNIKTLSFLFKFIFIVHIISSLSIILLQFKIPLIYVLGVDLTIVSIILFLWWRELLLFFTNLHIKRYSISQIYPFSNVRFYRFKQFRDTLYIYIKNNLLLGIKMFNLRNVVQPSFVMPDKFFRSMNNQKTPFTYTLNATPIERKEFVNKCQKLLNDKTKDELEGIISIRFDGEPTRYYKNPDAEYLNWMERRTGLWRTFITISTSSYKFTNISTVEDLLRGCDEIEKELHSNATNMGRAFQQNFKKHFLTQLKGHILTSGFLNECFKNTIFRLGGTHLNQVYFQGKKLIELTHLANEFKKGLDTKVAAEFNTPLHIDNFITLGHTINTEFLEKEVPLGFTLKQIKQLLITNGTSEDREHLKMKLTAELIKAGIPCVIFDYTGDWSKLVRYFNGSRYESSFLHFKVGQSFNINLIYSGIKYDTTNLEYLNYFYDVFALAFKAKDITINLLKKSIKENEKLDWNSIALDMVVKPDFKVISYSENLLNIFQDFIDQSVFFSDRALEYENDIAPLDFIKTNKTVIIDLSRLNDLEQQTFATFVILSKFINFIKHSHDYHQKVLCIPNIDLFFDQQYIDNNFNSAHYGKIDKLLTPLKQSGFGFIFSANQIHYLHPNVFNYLKNIITFRATDSRDISVLKNNMHLQELQDAGYYSNKRNNTYQIEYLMAMRNHEIIVKREDIFQPFPAKIEVKKISKMLPYSNERIYEYMERQGYNLKQSEQKLLAKLKKTLFEKDLGIYHEFIEEVKNFLNGISSVHNIGTLSKHTIKVELMNYIFPKASKRTSNRRSIKTIRNDIFQLLLKHGYLEENHPARASGTESIRTSYKVGNYYQKALDDEAQYKMNLPINVDVEAIEGDMEYNPFDVKIAQERPVELFFDDLIYQKELLEETRNLSLIISKIYSYYLLQEYEESLHHGKNLMNTFFTNLYNAYTKKTGGDKLNFEKISHFVEYLAENNKIPFTLSDLRGYLEKLELYLSNNFNLGTSSYNVYELVKEFRTKLWNYTNH